MILLMNINKYDQFLNMLLILIIISCFYLDLVKINLEIRIAI